MDRNASQTPGKSKEADRLGAECTVQHAVPLSQMTTFRIGGPAAELVTAYSERAFVDAAGEADRRGMPLLVIGGGSNMLCADEGFAGRVVHDGRTDVLSIEPRGESWVRYTAPAGMTWDDAVADSLSRGYAGLESLSGIPGTVGAAPIQNVGAYGHEVSETIESVEAYDRRGH